MGMGTDSLPASPLLCRRRTLGPKGVKYPRMLANTADLTAEVTASALITAAKAGIFAVDFHDNAEIGGFAETSTSSPALSP